MIFSKHVTQILYRHCAGKPSSYELVWLCCSVHLTTEPPRSSFLNAWSWKSIFICATVFDNIRAFWFLAIERFYLFCLIVAYSNLFWELAWFGWFKLVWFSRRYTCAREIYILEILSLSSQDNFEIYTVLVVYLRVETVSPNIIGIEPWAEHEASQGI